MVIVDTSVWVDYLRGVENPETIWLDLSLSHRRFGLTDLILCEVLQGIHPSTFSKVRDGLLKFHVFQNGGTDLAVASAQSYRQLRRLGLTVSKTIDCLIATFCLTRGHELLHRDHDFDAFEKALGLQVVHAK